MVPPIHPARAVASRRDSLRRVLVAALRRGRGHRWRGTASLAGMTALAVALLVPLAAPSSAATPARRDPGRWKLVAQTAIPVFYYQGMTQDDDGHFYFDGIDNGLFVTDDRFHELGGSTPYIPTAVAARDKYNHIGAIAFDRHLGVLLPMECYDEATGANCADTGAIGVAAPVSLRWRYEVKLDPSTIKKAMWAAVSPDGSLLWTSSGNNLLAYRTSDLTAAHAWPAHPVIKPVRELHGAVPASGVTGATFYRGRLYLAGNVGNDYEVWSVDTANGSRRLEISRQIVGESEGLDAYVTDHGAVHAVPSCSRVGCTEASEHQPNHFGGVLHWMIQPITGSSSPPTYPAPTILSFDPVGAGH